MKNPMAMLAIGAFFGTGLGFLLAVGSGAELEGHDHDHATDHDAPIVNAHAGHETAALDHCNVSQVGEDHHNHHAPVDTAADSPKPGISIFVHPDAVSGWNLEILTENFEFSPQTVNEEHRDGQGHAHVYVNGEKLARLYTRWLYIESLPRGENTITVTLNSNDHRVIAVEGEKVSAEQIVQVN
ncbi:hypothetical protein GCM10007939_20250 [Amylibacter marinus]|uniref:Uncharacterized protein n=1 Tax=Amylibacter marinus TaxID=1475483 RepID=A0ABQ5VWD7_9RHOB|nr:hypothetical protein [Amylibacter marinus]GLQ35742.1 hypothetical protein GCM10007939_20250 [Amylibacter marinus]